MAPVIVQAAQLVSGMTAIALVLVVFVTVLAVTTTLVVFAHRRRLRRRIPPTIQVEAQVQVQVQVQKTQAAIGATPSSCPVLPFPVTASPARSSSDSLVQRMVGKHRAKSQPPAKKETKWFAFDSNETLATLDHDPLEDNHCDVPPTFAHAADGSSAVSAPSLVSGTTSPATFHEPQTPPPSVHTQAVRKPDASFSSDDYEIDLGDIDINSERYATLIYAISASFSTSTLGLPSHSSSEDSSPAPSNFHQDSSRNSDNSGCSHCGEEDKESGLGIPPVLQSSSLCEHSVFGI